MRIAMLIALLYLAGCPDPTSAPSSSSDDARQTPPGEAPTAQPAPQGAEDAQAPPPSQAMRTSFSAGAEDGVAVEGTLAYSGEKSGKIRLDFLVVKENQAPQLVHTLQLDEFGRWSVTAPRDFGELYVVGFLDQTGNGPSPDDPADSTKTPILVGTEPLSGIDLVLSDDPDLGALTPGSHGQASAGQPVDQPGGGAAGSPPAGPTIGSGESPETTPPTESATATGHTDDVGTD